MIDIENEIVTLVHNTVTPIYESAQVVSELNLSPSVFPNICVEEVDNATYNSSADSKSNENHADIIIEINIFTNRTSGKKAQAKAIENLINNALVAVGFTRTMSTPIALNNGTMYRRVSRYSAIVDTNNTIFGR